MRGPVVVHACRWNAGGRVQRSGFVVRGCRVRGEQAVHERVHLGASGGVEVPLEVVRRLPEERMYGGMVSL